jgi:hypothetical protein
MSIIISSSTAIGMSITPVEVNSDKDSNVLSNNNEVDPDYMLLELYY